MSAHLEEGRGAMGDDAVALHLPKAQAAVPGAPLNGLPGQDLHWTPAARVDLVIHLQNTVMTFTDAQSAYGESQSNQPLRITNLSFQSTARHLSRGCLVKICAGPLLKR